MRAFAPRHRRRLASGGPLESFGYDPDEAYVEWTGGYLDSETAVVTIAGETEDEQEW
ncbi:hypothetical protein [Micromonospora sp. NPDC050200]|uniref:hypothetical protein n=1 Tax=Micromonospora sp. NPDC050200 TaxID=3155664 RepID=UPI0033CB541B